MRDGAFILGSVIPEVKLGNAGYAERVLKTFQINANNVQLTCNRM
jgi:hypothetical protein